MRALPVLLAALCGCGDRSPDPGPGGTPVTPVTPAAGATITLAWSFGEPPTKSEGGPRMRDPNEPLPTGPAIVAVGSGRVAIATQDACLELLDLATGKPLVPRSCEKEAFASGLAVLDDTVVSCVRNGVRGFSKDDLKLVWARDDLGFIVSQYQMLPRAVGGAFCVVSEKNVTCLAPRTGKTVGTIALRQGNRVALADQVIAVVDGNVVRFHRPDGGVVSEKELSGTGGPTIEGLAPLLIARGGDAGKWTTRFVDPKGTPLLEVTTKGMLRGGGLVGGMVVTSDFVGASKNGDEVVALDPATGAEKWRTPIGGSGPYDPFIAGAGGRVYAAHYDRVAAFAQDTGPCSSPSIPIASDKRAVWSDRVLLLVEAHETRSDSDIGNAGVYAIDMPTGQVLLRDDLGRDVPGGQQADVPIIAGDTAVVVARGQVRAYRMKP